MATKEELIAGLNRDLAAELGAIITYRLFASLATGPYRQEIRSFFERAQRPMPESNAAQALVPKGREVVTNPRGTAPGIHYCRDETYLFALPGVPLEMKAMFDQS